MENEETISIWGRDDDDGEDRALRKRLGEFLYRTNEVDVNRLKEQLETLVKKMGGIIQSLPAITGNYQLDTVTFSVEVSAKGSVSLLGTGGELAGKGGLTFTLKKMPGACDEDST